MNELNKISSYFIFLMEVVRIELRTSYMVNTHSTTALYHLSLVIFKK